MGQKPGCCSKEFEKNLGRKSVPIDVINNVPEPILKSTKIGKANPFCPELYGDFHCKTNPLKHVVIKVHIFLSRHL